MSYESKLIDSNRVNESFLKYLNLVLMILEW